MIIRRNKKIQDEKIQTNHPKTIWWCGQFLCNDYFSCNNCDFYKYLCSFKTKWYVFILVFSFLKITFFLASNGLTDKHLPTYEAMYNQNQTTKSLNLQNPIQRSSTPDSG
jgi:hypothetical protein